MNCKYKNGSLEQVANLVLVFFTEQAILLIALSYVSEHSQHENPFIVNSNKSVMSEAPLIPMYISTVVEISRPFLWKYG